MAPHRARATRPAQVDRATLAAVAQALARLRVEEVELVRLGRDLDLLRRAVESGQSNGIFRRSLHPQLVAKAIFGILDEMVTSWMLSEKDYPLVDQADQVAELVLTGLSASR